METATKCPDHMTADFPNSKKYKPTGERSSGKKCEIGVFKARCRAVTPGMWGANEATPSRPSWLSRALLLCLRDGEPGGAPERTERQRESLCRHRAA